MKKHTPGPWMCYADTPSADPNWHIVTNESRMRIIANVHIEPGNLMDAANADLIAAAPTMKDALIFANLKVQRLCQELGRCTDADTQQIVDALRLAGEDI